MMVLERSHCYYLICKTIPFVSETKLRFLLVISHRIDHLIRAELKAGWNKKENCQVKRLKRRKKNQVQGMIIVFGVSSE